MRRSKQNGRLVLHQKERKRIKLNLLDVQNLEVGYNGIKIAGPISFHVTKGDYLSIIGENGSGKSTLLKTILGLNEPISGTVQMAQGKRIGYLPQQTTLQRDFPATVQEIVRTGILPQKKTPFFTSKENDLVKDVLIKVGAIDFMNRNFRDLSGGQQQRVLIARALLNSKDLLLLDEPVTGLDPESQTELYQMIRDLNKKGIAIIMISHDKDAFLTESKHILHIGHMPFYGTVDQYKKCFEIRKEAC